MQDSQEAYELALKAHRCAIESGLFTEKADNFILLALYVQIYPNVHAEPDKFLTEESAVLHSVATGILEASTVFFMNFVRMKTAFHNLAVVDEIKVTSMQDAINAGIQTYHKMEEHFLCIASSPMLIYEQLTKLLELKRAANSLHLQWVEANSTFENLTDDSWELVEHNLNN